MVEKSLFLCLNMAMDRIRLIKEKNFDELPKTSGVYFFYSKKKLIYIGKAINIKNRVKNHFQQPSYRDNLYIKTVNKIGFIETKSEIEALILEANLIKKHQPRFNVVWRDDKNYFFVAITQNKDKIPYVFITHQPNSSSLRGAVATKQSRLLRSARNDEIKYIGPFVEGTALKKTLRFLRKVFSYYTNKKHSKNKCTYCHLDLCPGPNPDLNEYKKNLKKLSQILQGKSQTVLNSLKKEMKKASKENKFEEAGKVRDQIFALQKIIAHANVIKSQSEIVINLSGDKNLTNFWDNTQKILQEIVWPSLRGRSPKQPIHRIECYDISNTQGNQATGSMVVFVDGVADKSQYKKFKIRLPEKPNDIAMLEEMITRRLTHPEWNYPEIMLIDGGIAQLNIAIKVKDSNLKTRSIKVISIAKRNKDLYIEGKDGFIPLKSLPREIYNLVLQLDDEAHRFAITYHKKLRKKSLLD